MITWADEPDLTGKSYVVLRMKPATFYLSVLALCSVIAVAVVIGGSTTQQPIPAPTTMTGEP